VFRDEDADEDHGEITDVNFEDCFQEEEKQEEPALHVEEMYFAPYNNLGNSEPVYEGNRKRVVRFLADQEDPPEESGDGGFMMMGGLAAAGGMAAAGMLASKANDALHQDSDASICMLDIFDEGGSSVNSNIKNSQNQDASVKDYDSSSNSLDEEEEQEKQIRKTMLMTMFGMGFMGLVGFGAKKLMNILSRGKDQDSGAMDIVGDGIDTATQATDTATHATDSASLFQTATQGSSDASSKAYFNANASSQSSKDFAMGAMTNNPAGMTGAQ
jgi:hypothetical protein